MLWSLSEIQSVVGEKNAHRRSWAVKAVALCCVSHPEKSVLEANICCTGCSVAKAKAEFGKHLIAFEITSNDYDQ